MNIGKLSDKFRSDVTPALSRVGKTTLEGHLELIRKRNEDEFGELLPKERKSSQSPVDSDGSFEKQLKEELEDVKWLFK